MLSADDFCDYVPNKFDIKQDIDYMNFHFQEWEGIPDHKWKPIFDPVEFDKQNKPLLQDDYRLTTEKMQEKGQRALCENEVPLEPYPCINPLNQNRVTYEYSSPYIFTFNFAAGRQERG